MRLSEIRQQMMLNVTEGGIIIRQVIKIENISSIKIQD